MLSAIGGGGTAAITTDDEHVAGAGAGAGAGCGAEEEGARKATHATSSMTSTCGSRAAAVVT